MAEASIPVDLANPGQVFACLGFLEAAGSLLGEGKARGGFDWREPDNACFWLAVPGPEDPVAHILRFLAEAEVKSLAPARSKNSTAKWGVETVTVESGRVPLSRSGKSCNTSRVSQRPRWPPSLRDRPLGRPDQAGQC